MRKGRRWLVAGVALLAVWIAVAPLLADNLITSKPVGKADAIVILSGAADHAQRARGGAEAYHSGVAATIWITDDDQRGGWDDTEKGNPYFVDRINALLINEGVPASAIERLPGKVYGTVDEAGSVLANARDRNYKSLLIVTSDYHSLRALWTFERTAEKVAPGMEIGLARCPSGESYPDRYTWWLTPRGWRTVGAEYVKFCWYWLFY